MILVGGYPGAGKSYVVHLIREMIPALVSINLDEMEEAAFDEYGFNNQEEKTALIEECRLQYYEEIRSAMERGELIISDYPFSYKQRPYFEKYSKEYGYKIITVRLVGNINKIYSRRIGRDLKQTRHLGHIVQKYHKGDVLLDRRGAESLITKKDFIDKIELSGYGTFAMGELIELDVSNFKTADYCGMLKKIHQIVKN